jgi:hypothetical protein
MQREVLGLAPSLGILLCPEKSGGGAAAKGSRVGQGDDGANRVLLGPQLGGRGPGYLPSVRLSICVQGRISRGPSVGSQAPPSLVPGPPAQPAVRMSDGCAPPQALGPRPGSRSLAADTVCFPARDAHPRHRPFLLAPPHPQGSRVLGLEDASAGQDLHLAPRAMPRWSTGLTLLYPPREDGP